MARHRRERKPRKHNGFWKTIGKGLSWTADHTIGLPMHMLEAVDHTANHMVDVGGSVVNTGIGAYSSTVQAVVPKALDTVGGVIEHGQDAIGKIFSSPMLIIAVGVGAFFLLNRK
jgi:hypothetical protein